MTIRTFYLVIVHSWNTYGRVLGDNPVEGHSDAMLCLALEVTYPEAVQ